MLSSYCISFGRFKFIINYFFNFALLNCETQQLKKRLNFNIKLIVWKILATWGGITQKKNIWLSKLVTSTNFMHFLTNNCYKKFFFKTLQYYQPCKLRFIKFEQTWSERVVVELYLHCWQNSKKKRSLVNPL